VQGASLFYNNAPNTGEQSHPAKKGMDVDQDGNGLFHVG
jgi:hypothetical protein